MKSYTEIPAWLAFKDIYTYIGNQYAKDGMRFLEIGVWQGGSVIYLAQLIKARGLKDVRIDAIDLFGADHPERPEGYQLYLNVIQNTADCGVHDLVCVKMGYSSKFVKNYDDNSLDFIFVDGDHEYSGVWNDIQNYWPKLKIGGMIAGDDYNHKVCPGIKPAVDECFRSQNVEFHPCIPNGANHGALIWSVIKTSNEL